jgi:hypothetical protein
MKSIIAILTLCFMFGCGGADKKSETADSEKESSTLCEEYTSCNDCIAGLQTARGINESQAETECGLASTGCWVTWEKPIKCGK